MNRCRCCRLPKGENRVVSRRCLDLQKAGRNAFSAPDAITLTDGDRSSENSESSHNDEAKEQTGPRIGDFDSYDIGARDDLDIVAANDFTIHEPGRKIYFGVRRQNNSAQDCAVAAAHARTIGTKIAAIAHGDDEGVRMSFASNAERRLYSVIRF